MDVRACYDVCLSMMLRDVRQYAFAPTCHVVVYAMFSGSAVSSYLTGTSPVDTSSLSADEIARDLASARIDTQAHTHAHAATDDAEHVPGHRNMRKDWEEL